MVIYHKDFDNHIGFINRGRVPNPNPDQHGLDGRKLGIPKNEPTWQLVISNKELECPLPPPRELPGEPGIEVEPGNVEVGDDEQ
jgi:hypothetical protein